MPAELDKYGHPLCWNCKRQAKGTQWQYECVLCDVKFYEFQSESLWNGSRMWTDPDFIREFRDDAVPDGYLDHGLVNRPSPA